MYSAVGTRENIKIIDSAEYGGVKIEVMEYQHLFGSTGTSAAMDLYFMEKQNIRARQVAVYLSNDMVTVEPGAMSYFRGPWKWFPVSPPAMRWDACSPVQSPEKQPHSRNTAAVVCWSWSLLSIIF